MKLIRRHVFNNHNLLAVWSAKILSLLLVLWNFAEGLLTPPPGAAVDLEPSTTSPHYQTSSRMQPAPVMINHNMSQRHPVPAPATQNMFHIKTHSTQTMNHNNHPVWNNSSQPWWLQSPEPAMRGQRRCQSPTGPPYNSLMRPLQPQPTQCQWSVRPPPAAAAAPPPPYATPPPATLRPCALL